MQSTATRHILLKSSVSSEQQTHCEVFPSTPCFSIQGRQEKRKQFTCKSKLICTISLCHFPPAKLHSYAQRHSITVAVAQLFTSQRFLYSERQAHVHLIGSHSVPQLCERSLRVCQSKEMAACISAWNKAPAPKWQGLDIVGKWMLNSLCNQQQQPLLWKINCTLAKGKGNCFAR